MSDHLENGLDVQVAVKDGAIIVTLPGTSFCVVYRKGAEPWLLCSDIRDDPNSPISKYTFRARAWTAANDRRVSWGGSFRLRDIAGLSGPELILEHFAKPHCAQTGEA